MNRDRDVKTEASYHRWLAEAAGDRSTYLGYAMKAVTDLPDVLPLCA
jgi:hypothetical protein